MRGSHALEAGEGPGWESAPGRRPGGAADHQADERNGHRLHVLAVDSVVSRPASAYQPVVQRDALGDAHAAVLADGGVLVAGGAYRPRDGAGGAGRDAADAGCV